MSSVKLESMKVAILIPTYNEKENIGLLLDELLLLAKGLKKHNFWIVVVDGNSPDGTGEIVKNYQKKNRRIILLSGKKVGLGADMVKGYRYVLKNLRADVVVTNEADFGFSFSHLAKMLGKIETGCDVVVASRHVGVGRSHGWTLSRKLNHWVANTFFARYLAGIREVYDKNGAFRAIRVKGVLEKINFANFPTRGFSFFFYLIYELSNVTDKFCEIPVVFHFRTRGESKVSFNPKYLQTYIRDTWEYAALAFQIRLERSKITLWPR